MKTIIKATIITAGIWGAIYLVDYMFTNYENAFQYVFLTACVVVTFVGVCTILKEYE